MEVEHFKSKKKKGKKNKLKNVSDILNKQRTDFKKKKLDILKRDKKIVIENEKKNKLNKKDFKKIKSRIKRTSELIDKQNIIALNLVDKINLANSKIIEDTLSGDMTRKETEKQYEQIKKQAAKLKKLKLNIIKFKKIIADNTKKFEQGAKNVVKTELLKKKGIAQFEINKEIAKRQLVVVDKEIKKKENIAKKQLEGFDNMGDLYGDSESNNYELLDYEVYGEEEGFTVIGVEGFKSSKKKSGKNACVTKCKKKCKTKKCKSNCAKKCIAKNINSRSKKNKKNKEMTKKQNKKITDAVKKGKKKNKQKDKERMALKKGKKANGKKLTVAEKIYRTFSLITIHDVRKVLNRKTGCPINFTELFKFIRDKIGEIILMMIIPAPVYYLIKLSADGKGLFKILQEKLDKMTAVYRNKVKILWGKLNNLTSAVTDEVDKQLKKMNEKINKKVNSFVEKYSGISKLVKMVNDKIKSLINKLNKIIKNMLGSITDIFDDQMKLFSEKVNKILKEIKNMKDKIVDAIIDFLGFKENIFYKIYLFYKKYSVIINLITYIPLIIYLYPHIIQFYNRFF